MAGNDHADGVLVQVCMKCGREYTFHRHDPPSDLECGKCGGDVFRSFYAHTRSDEADDDFREVTERDVGTTDPATDVTRGDLHDLGNM